MKEGIVGGEAFAVDASIIVADAHRRRGVEKVANEWGLVCLAHNILKLAQGRTPSLGALATG